MLLIDNSELLFWVKAAQLTKKKKTGLDLKVDI